MDNNEKDNIKVVDNSSLLELINSIQDKMNNQTKDNKDENINEVNNETSSNENSTINSQILDDTTINNTKSQKENIDFSSIASMLNNINLSNVLSLFSNMNSNTDSNKEENKDFIFDKLDPNLIIKIQRIITSMGKNDPRKDLLKSLKPFLRKSRQDKLGEYITILNVINAIQIFYDKGSDENVKI